ncbi:MarP family serine protease [Agromyces aerolatus]|uniref:MarP family serine protease n=1 Tax=Agromyces sp. LY-1074 TaxID=3074080 RepID=UPI002861B326|nr:MULTISPECIES: MarP family serine protease [unclassified Agromyces]MDR5698253.1 MarP family serine protease [Agromyces sp. LY-1074]MDR5704547.1 MarP family serine protease [Agromyces sp. LY-1358]
MTWSLLLDILLVLILIGALVNGFRAGLLRTAAGLAGLVAGGIAAYFVMPWVTSIVPAAEWRAPAAIAAAIVLLVGGSWLGAAVGRVLRRGARAVKLGVLDRVLGAIGNVIVTAFVIALVASGVTSLGVPVLSPAVAGSWVVRGIDQATPAPARTLMAELRTATIGGAIPWLGEVLGGPTEPPQLPDGSLDTPELSNASASVVRITGTAFECGSSMSGSGFVVAPNRIVTNAHVVAGVTQPIVEAPGRAPVQGRVVAYQPEHDLALIAVDGLDVDPLAVAERPVDGTQVAVAGYPFGGPYQMRPAQILTTGPLTIVEAGTESTREVATLAAKVDHGNSGGPVLTLDGEIGGVVFAKSETVDNVGYAIPVTTLEPLAATAGTLSAPVDSGSCVR